ncbi:unnamed protein product [Vitrella brassicaformis CCMP3155]|uniref:PROP1-like PPR domain-containing protein n=1 Tax=Vitrella brassicaformis (strain CCMP3155) TaxID=1169540 RepID=A0A0G4E968_VITBC|nr:unnamed protein product [Vitrella brassicaformis CCMP3155]|eukprot:CEL91763.1 unnamed protein product [Vitrella brassicaformis CCMP3155]
MVLFHGGHPVSSYMQLGANTLVTIAEECVIMLLLALAFFLIPNVLTGCRRRRGRQMGWRNTNTVANKTNSKTNNNTRPSRQLPNATTSTSTINTNTSITPPQQQESHPPPPPPPPPHPQPHPSTCRLLLQLVEPGHTDAEVCEMWQHIYPAAVAAATHGKDAPYSPCPSGIGLCDGVVDPPALKAVPLARIALTLARHYNDATRVADEMASFLNFATNTATSTSTGTGTHTYVPPTAAGTTAVRQWCRAVLRYLLLDLSKSGEIALTVSFSQHPFTQNFCSRPFREDCLLRAVMTATSEAITTTGTTERIISTPPACLNTPLLTVLYRLAIQSDQLETALTLLAWTVSRHHGNDTQTEGDDHGGMTMSTADGKTVVLGADVGELCHAACRASRLDIAVKALELMHWPLKLPVDGLDVVLRHLVTFPQHLHTTQPFSLSPSPKASPSPIPTPPTSTPPTTAAPTPPAPNNSLSPTPNTGSRPMTPTTGDGHYQHQHQHQHHQQQHDRADGDTSNNNATIMPHPHHPHTRPVPLLTKIEAFAARLVHERPQDLRPQLFMVLSRVLGDGPAAMRKVWEYLARTIDSRHRHHHHQQQHQEGRLLTEQLVNRLLAGCEGASDVGWATEVLDRYRRETHIERVGWGGLQPQQQMPQAVREALSRAYGTIAKMMVGGGMWSSLEGLLHQMRTDGLTLPQLYLRPVFDAAIRAHQVDIAANILNGCGEDEGNVHVTLHLTLIRAYGAAGKLPRAMEVFRRLVECPHVVPNALMYNVALNTCVDSGDFNQVVSLVGEMLDRRFLDVASFNTIVKGFVSSGMCVEAREVVKLMRNYDVRPNRVTYNTLLGAATHKNTPNIDEWVDEALSMMAEDQVAPNAHTCCALLDSLLPDTHPDVVKRRLDVVRHLPDTEMDEVLLTSMVDTCIRMSLTDLLPNMLPVCERQLRRKSVQDTGDQATTSHDGILAGSGGLSPSIYGALIRGYGRLGAMGRVWELWRELKALNVPVDKATTGCFVEALVANKDVDTAFQVLEELEAATTPTPTARDLHKQQQQQHHQQQPAPPVLPPHTDTSPTSVSTATSTTLDSYAFSPPTHHPTIIHTKGLAGGMRMGVSGISGPSSYGQENVSGNPLLYCTVLKGLAQAHKIDDALQLYKTMEERGVAMDAAVYSELLEACAKCKRADHVEYLLSGMRQRGMCPDASAQLTALKAYCSSGDTDSALRYYTHLKTQGTGAMFDEHTYNAVIECCGSPPAGGKDVWCENNGGVGGGPHRRGASQPTTRLADQALAVLEDMKRANVPPTNRTLTGLVKVLGRARQVKKAFQLLEQVTTQYSE